METQIALTAPHNISELRVSINGPIGRLLNPQVLRNKMLPIIVKTLGPC